MKLSHGILAASGVFFAGAFSYYVVVERGDLPHRVEEQGEEIDRLFETANLAVERIGRQPRESQNIRSPENRQTCLQFAAFSPNRLSLAPLED